MNKQTAVEYLIEMIKLNDKDFYATLFEDKVFDKAKAMEKEQIEDAYWEGGQDVPVNGKRCEEYYNKTFNK